MSGTQPQPGTNFSPSLLILNIDESYSIKQFMNESTTSLIMSYRKCSNHVSSKKPKISPFRRLSWEDLLLFLVLCDNKLNIWRFWTVGEKKRSI